MGTPGRVELAAVWSSSPVRYGPTRPRRLLPRKLPAGPDVQAASGEAVGIAFLGAIGELLG
jgi:hypothetical protein